MMIHLTTSTKKNPLSPLIRFIEKRKFSHVVLNFYDDYIKKEVYFQSNMKGMIYMGKSLFEKQNTIIKSYIIHTNEAEDRLLRNRMLELSGYDYDIPNLFKGALNKFLKFLNFSEIKWKGNGDKKTVCSELVIHILYPVFGGKMKLTKDADFYTPSDLESLLDDLSEKESGFISKLIP